MKAKLDEITRLERMLHIVRRLKERYTKEEARLLRLLKQKKMATKA